MKKINDTFHSTPDEYDRKFNGVLGIWDMERHYKLSKYFKKGVYVDLGCFDSIMPILIAERTGTKVYALDHSPKMIDFLKARFPKVNYLCHDVMSLPFEDNSVDCVCAGELIEHLPDPQAFVTEVMRVLKPGGWFSISTPHEEVGNSVGGKYHMWSWTVDDVKRLLGTDEVEVLQESSSKSILAWRKK